MNVGSVVGYLLLLSATLLFLFPITRWSPLPRAIAVVVCFGIGFARIGELRLIAYPAGVLGDLSITTQILLASAILKRVAGIDSLPDADRSFLLTVAGSTGLILYALSSGLTPLDLYALGFGSGTFMVVLTLATMICWRYRPRVALTVLICVLSYDVGLLTSDNVWDYLLDPVLVLFAWVWALAATMRGLHSPAQRRVRP